MPTTSQLIDRLCIVTLKSIKIPENKEEYEKAAMILKKIDKKNNKLKNGSGKY